ncbi:hypothetical protein HZB03_04950 [Candidatus Woesearchaeota archaeon]|nr:hypothetical protein [Candidatus Woesearchaeota archaeon]
MTTKRFSALSAILTMLLLTMSSFALARPVPDSVNQPENTNLAAISISSDGTPVAGQPATFRALIVNEGTNGLEDVSWQAQGSDGRVITGVISYIAAQNEQTLDFEFAFDPALSGDAWLLFMVDPQNSIEESNEEDNRVDVSLNVAPARLSTQEPSRENPQDPQDPLRENPRDSPRNDLRETPTPTADVRVNRISVTPGRDDERVTSGKTALVQVFIENNGDELLETVEWGFFTRPGEFDASNNAPPLVIAGSTTDYAMTGRELNLHPGEIRVVNFEYTFEARQSEDFTVGFAVDPWNMISEANEENNVRGIGVHVDLPASRSRDDQRPVTPDNNSTVTAPAASTPSSSTSTSSSSSSSSKKKKSKSTNNDDKESAKNYFFSKETLKQQFLKETLNKFSKDKAAASVAGTPQSQASKNGVIEVVYAEMPEYVEVTEHVCKFKLFGWCLWGKDVKVKVPVPKMAAPQTFYV